MSTARAAQAAGAFAAAVALHYGPGPHPDGSPQAVHAGGQMAFDLDAPAQSTWQGKYLPGQEQIAGGEAQARLNASAAEIQVALVQLREWTIGSPLVVRRSIRGATGVLTDGRFKTQFETGTSSGSFDPEFRQLAEERGLGIPADIDPRERPVYGYFEVRGNEASAYGDVQFVLKPEVKRRSTVALDDSLGAFWNRGRAGTPALEPGVASLGWRARRIAAGDLNVEYIEAQIQGGVTLDDVQEIVFKAGANLPTSEGLPPPRFWEIAALAKKRGIPYRVDWDNG